MFEVFDILVQVAKIVLALFVAYYMFPAFVFAVMKAGTTGFILGKHRMETVLRNEAPANFEEKKG